MDIPITKIKNYFSENNLSYLITVFVNIKYKSVLANWIQFMYKSNIYHFIIVCTDKFILKKCLEYNIFCIYYPIDTENNLDQLWIKRVEFLKELVHNDIPIIHSDLDAIWTNDPIPFLNNINKQASLDIIGSQGLIFPEFSFRKNGFIMCCGFFAVNPTPNSKKWMSKWFYETLIFKDDQVAFNKLLAWTKIKLTSNLFDNEKNKKKQYKQIIKIYNKKYLLNLNSLPRIGSNSKDSEYPLNFCLLPMTQFQRIPLSPCKKELIKNKQVFIKHFFTQKNEIDKIKLFQKEEIWEEDSTLFFTSLKKESDVEA